MKKTLSRVLYWPFDLRPVSPRTEVNFYWKKHKIILQGNFKSQLQASMAQGGASHGKMMQTPGVL